MHIPIVGDIVDMVNMIRKIRYEKAMELVKQYEENLKVDGE